VEGEGLVTAGIGAPRGPAGGARRLTLAVVLAVGLLAGCEAAQQAQQGVDKATDCAGLVGELTGIDWNDVRRAPARAEEAAQRLDRRLREVNDAEVKQAGEALRDRVRRLAEAARNANPAEVQRALADVEAAARRLANTCGVNVDQVGGG
jgi:outer membrane murein-binding lipoprotein Lpp